ncbi:MAG: hypothetical protein HFE45_03095 [Oscillospiraceae bacterium]|nr:hypothetical protein [Oscillospiraceae bacterium]
MIAIAADEDKRYLVEYLHIDNADWLALTDIREIAKRYRAATQYEHIFVDLSFLQNEEDEVLDALSGLYAISTANLILLACGYEPGSKLLSELVKGGMYNIITAESPGAVNADATACLKGKTLKDVRYLLIPEEPPKQKSGLFSFFRRPVKKPQPEPQPKQQLRIGVAGVIHRIGTTTVAMQIARYFQQIGWKACYIDCTGDGQLAYYPHFWENVQQDKQRDCFRMEGLDLYAGFRDQLAKDYEALVYDYGVFSEAGRLSYLDKEKKILVCGCKPQELLALPEVFEATEGSEIFFVFSFVGATALIYPESREAVLKILFDAWQTIVK